MKDIFFRLEPERRERLLDACAREFGERGYALASTNSIVKACGISKGLFFKYFGSKESVYLYLAKCVLEDLGDIQGSSAPFESKDILSRAEELFARHMEYAQEFPLRYKFILRALLESDSSIHAKVAALRDEVSRSTTGGLYEGIDWSMYRYPGPELIDFLHCLDIGLKQAAIQELGEHAGIEEFKACVARRLVAASRILTSGVYRDSMHKEDGNENRDRSGEVREGLPAP